MGLQPKVILPNTLIVPYSAEDQAGLRSRAMEVPEGDVLRK
jgi:hypothetical protein